MRKGIPALGVLFRMRLPRSLLLLVSLAASGLLAACGPDYPNCEDDDNCHEGEFCVNGTCQDCRTNADCPAGQQCTSGACEEIPGYCDTQTACPSGQECVNNRCQATQTTDACAAVSCPAGSRCDAGTCVPDTSTPSCELEPVMFEYDSDALDEADRRTLQTDARCIAESRPAGVHTTGHADERGTEEYNLALSERRAQQVLRYLQSLGVSSPLSASGMGEEMSTGADEAAWRHDRRVDLHRR